LAGLCESKLKELGRRSLQSLERDAINQVQQSLYARSNPDPVYLSLITIKNIHWQHFRFGKLVLHQDHGALHEVFSYCRMKAGNFMLSR
jgi:hypothetical protein